MSDYYVGGVDGAGGWLAVAYADGEFDHAAVFEGVGELWSRYEERAERIAIDVPIGLNAESAPRPNERLARRLLGERAEAVVPAPVREATRKRRYRAAARVHERRTGDPLPEAAFGTAPAANAVDEFLDAIDEARPVFAEAHPEICYLAFAGEPMEDPPGTAGGYAERMRTLAEFDAGAPPSVQSAAEATAGERIEIPAVVDAVALGLTVRPGPGSLRSLPAEPETDGRGLPMRYVYRSEAALSE